MGAFAEITSDSQPESIEPFTADDSTVEYFRPGAGDERVIVSAPLGQDARAIADLLTSNGFEVVISQNPKHAAEQIAHAGALVMTEEVLEFTETETLLAALQCQPPWSELPVIILTSGGASRLARLLDLTAQAAGSVTLLERPIRTDTLLRAIHVALRSRRRQYQVRDLFEEQKRTQEKLKQNGEQLRSLLAQERGLRQAADEANRIKDEFLATISHELRNPLNVILGYSEVLVRSKEANESEFVQRAAEILRRNAIAQAQLVSDLLDLSRLQLGKFSLNRQVVSLTKTINDAVETVRDEAEAKGLEVKIEMSNELVFVDGDPLRMEQIVWNLLNNAVKFTPSGGTVTVKLAKRDGLAQLAVADTGQGIEPKFLPHVFEIFRQADATISRRHGGMGIGLALVQQLVQLQGGSVSVSSGGAGRGAEFVISLPVTTEATEPRKSGGLVQPNALTGMRILVVDDSADTVDMLRTLLEMDGAVVSTAAGGPEALKILAQESFDVILSDISMPGMDGFELLNRLRKLPNGREVPVLALTGFGRAEDVERAKSVGFFSHITKPVDVSAIVAMLQKLPARPQP